MFGIEDALPNVATDIYEAIEWPGVVFLMAIESACIPFPSEIIMPLAGWILVKDRGHGLEFLLLAAFYGALGHTIGSIAASYPWSLALAWAGYMLGENWDSIVPYFRPVSIPIAIAVVGLVALFVYRRLRELRQSGAEGGPAGPP